MDGSYGPAYLLLGRLREQEGDPGEALRVYGVAIDRVYAFADGLLARAGLLERMGRREDAARDLHRALAFRPEDSRIGQAVMAFFVRWRAWPAALQLARTGAVALHRLGDEPSAMRARTQAIALSTLAAETDTTISGKERRAWQRRSIAAISRRVGAL